MNKVLNINLGGYPFVIDEDAYAHLRSYISALSKHFAKSEGREEIISDIENRIAELLTEKTSVRSIVTRMHIDEAIAIMGTPEDFIGDSYFDEEMRHHHGRKYRESGYKTGKRLFRNTDDKVIGGVCSGIAAYFGIEDPLWVRIGFAFFLVTGGIAAPLYFIIWAITPAAKSTADRLAMRGEPINVSNIAKSIEEEIDNLSETINEIGNQFGSKKKFKAKAQEAPLRQGFMF